MHNKDGLGYIDLQAALPERNQESANCPLLKRIIYRHLPCLSRVETLGPTKHSSAARPIPAQIWGTALRIRKAKVGRSLPAQLSAHGHEMADRMRLLVFFRPRNKTPASRLHLLMGATDCKKSR